MKMQKEEFMKQTKLDQIAKLLSPENKKIRNLKCVGLINFESRINFADSLSAQIREYINNEINK